MDAPAVCKPVCAQNTALIPSVRLGGIPVGEIGAGTMLWLVFSLDHRCFRFLPC